LIDSRIGIGFFTLMAGLFFCLATVGNAGAGPIEDWAAWRGPRGDGTSTETAVPTTWGADSNIHWKTPIPGKGHSSPVIHGDRVYLTTCIKEKEQRVLMCLDRKTGKILWQRVVLTAKLERIHRLNSYSSSTPATDGKLVWVTFLQKPNLRVFCYTADGKKVWDKTPGEFHSVHGFCSPPIPFKDMIIVNGDQDAKAYIVALHKRSGKEVWRVDRPRRTRSYCPPTIFEAAGKTQMVQSGNKTVTSYDPNNGKLHWIIDGPTDQMVASVVMTRDVFFVSGGFPEHHLLGMPVNAKGKLSESDVLWHLRGKVVSYVPSPVAHGDYFFIVSDRGVASCFDAKTGKQMWEQDMARRHSSSLVYADGHVYFLGDDGRCWVVKAGPKYQQVALNDLKEKCNASPAISRGQIFIRGDKHLFCIGKPQ